MAYRHLLAGVRGGSRCVLRSVMVYVGELRRPGKRGGRLRGIPLRSTFQYRIPQVCLPSCFLHTSSGPRCADRLCSRRPRCLHVVARRRRLRGLPLPDGGAPLWGLLRCWAAAVDQSRWHPRRYFGGKLYCKGFVLEGPLHGRRSSGATRARLYRVFLCAYGGTRMHRGWSASVTAAGAPAADAGANSSRVAAAGRLAARDETAATIGHCSRGSL